MALFPHSEPVLLEDVSRQSARLAERPLSTFLRFQQKHVEMNCRLKRAVNKVKTDHLHVIAIKRIARTYNNLQYNFRNSTI